MEVVSSKPCRQLVFGHFWHKPANAGAQKQLMPVLAERDRCSGDWDIQGSGWLWALPGLGPGAVFLRLSPPPSSAIPSALASVCNSSTQLGKLTASKLGLCGPQDSDPRAEQAPTPAPPLPGPVQQILRDTLSDPGWWPGSHEPVKELSRCGLVGRHWAGPRVRAEKRPGKKGMAFPTG